MRRRRNIKLEVYVLCAGCVLKAVLKLGHKCQTVNPIGMRAMGGETKHQIGQLSCRNVAKILPRN